MGWQVVYVPFLFAGDTIIDQDGIFVYNGTPGPGNLKISISATAGTDPFGNVYTDNVATYNVAVAGGGYAQIAANPSTGQPFLVLNPPGAKTLAVFPQVASSVSNPGAVNEYLGTTVFSGNELIPGISGDAELQLTSRSNDGTIAAIANLQADVTETTLLDTNVYRLGQKDYSASAISVAVTTPVTLLTIGPLAAGQNYRIQGWAIYIGNQAAGAPIFSWGASGGLVLGTIQNGYQRFTGGGVSPIIHNDNGALGAVTGPAFAANTTNWLYDFDINVSVTTGGSLLITGAENTAGDSFVIGQISAKLMPY